MAEILLHSFVCGMGTTASSSSSLPLHKGFLRRSWGTYDLISFFSSHVHPEITAKPLNREIGRC